MRHEFNPDRLDLARRRRGMSRQTLAQATGLTNRSLFRHFRGECDPKLGTVNVFAEVLDFPPEFFYGPTLDDIATEGPSFRSMSNLTVRERERAVAAGILGVALADWIDSRFQLPDPDVPQYDTAGPEDAAAAVRNQWGLGVQPIGNMIHLLERQGVRIFSLAEDTQSIDAYSFWRNDTPFIFLNTAKTAERSRMDAAHELGHLVLHAKGGSQRSRKAEHDAQLFGAAFLMPEDSVLGKVRCNIPVTQIIKAKSFWKVSAAGLAYRMRQLNLLTEHHYKRTFVELNRRGYLKGEPESIQRETSQLLEKAFGILRAKGISVAGVASELNIYPEELSKFLFRLVDFPVLVRSYC